MARRKKKKSLFSSSLKYEIYGIIWITLSVIALAGEATVGRSFTKMFGLVLGKFYFVIPIIGVYVGLYVMVKRKWPLGWSARRSGMLIIVLALTLMSTIWTIDHKLPPTVDVTANRIISQIHNDMKTELLTPGTAQYGSIYQKQISGGYMGAFSYAVLFWLFGALGAKLMMIVLFGIGVMLTANMSYVELLRWIKQRLFRFQDLIRIKVRSAKRTKKANKPALKLHSKKKPLRDLHDEDEEDDYYETDEQGEEASPKRKTMPLFFQLFGGKTGSTRPRDEIDEEDDYLDRGVIMTSPQQVVKLEDDEDPIRPLEQSSHAVPQGPIFRDFQESALSSSEDEEMDGPDEHMSPVVGHSHQNVSNPQSLHDHVEPALTDSLGNDHEGLQDDANHTITNGEQAPAAQDTESAESTPVVVMPPPKPYLLPNFRLLSKPQGSGKNGDQPDFMQTARKLEATLESFGVRAKVLEVVRGPAVTRYEIQPDIGVKVSRIVSLTDDIALALAAKDIRMEAPIPGKSAIGIEVPNSEVSIVTMREVMETQIFSDSASKLSIAFGRDISGQTIVGNLARMPHLLVAGATGSGKSVCINGIITSILYKAKPDEVKFLMIDPKMVELNVYNGIPHLLAPVVTDPKRASLALKKIVVEMEKRYELFSKSGTRNIEGYNKLMDSNPAAVLPFIVVIVDELADLMMVASNDVEDAICRLAQMARAAGIHLIIATQRPSVDVITGVIKANIPSRIAFGVSSQVDSRTILDMVGAEKLLGRGDMLFLPMGSSKPLRVQGAFLSDEEVESVVEYCRNQGQAVYNEDLVPEIDETTDQPEEIMDELYDQAVQIVLEAKQASVSLLQRRMRVGYTRAARLIDSMEAHGVVGPYEGSKPREVLISMEQHQNNNRISS
ncbi:cell division protein FtsK [Paenibacillus selenitireducens]|uniref:Cell division protein FtsK n=1 Tax=Paenibacillus selenitireducens TaxID=1324314 RepID=A0A1T2XCT9_9BACL|nr:DNA translocase FtsK [Paenibacillus selenitireducens]OPA77655.1 cell division protein FtsK [Paenibacillus selenitireducens]